MDIKASLTTIAVAVILPSCNGMFSDIYDAPVSDSEYGFIEISASEKPRMIYIDATDYTRWTYVNFKDMKIDTLYVTDPEPAKWDIAIHRYDVKTNHAAVAETPVSEISDIRTMEGLENLPRVEDMWTTDKIVIDMSTMMDGYLSYAESYYNTELSKWLNVDTGTMPPVYTPSEKVYVIFLRDGKRAAVKLHDYMNSAGAKGYMSIQYVYPL